MTGYCGSTLSAPVVSARIELLSASATEEFCRALWDLIVDRLDEWKWRHGTPPDRSQSFGLLSTNPWRGVSNDDVPAYGWTAQPFDSFAGLLRQLIDEKYETIVAIEAKVSSRLFWAVVTLAEATGPRSAGAVLAYGYLESARRQELLDHNSAMLADMKAITPWLQRAAPFMHGRPKGAVDGFSKLLANLLAADPDVSTKDAWARLPTFAVDEIEKLDSDTLQWSGPGAKPIVVSWSSGAFARRMSDARARQRAK